MRFYKNYCEKMFLRSDIQADNSLELKEYDHFILTVWSSERMTLIDVCLRIIEWVEGNGKAMELFARFGNNLTLF